MCWKGLCAFGRVWDLVLLGSHSIRNLFGRKAGEGENRGEK
jgi:hypothetical protein